MLAVAIAALLVAGIAAVDRVGDPLAAVTAPAGLNIAFPPSTRV
jgi:hypothetical protein